MRTPCLAALAAAAFALPALAVTLIPLTDQEIAAHAAHAVVGTVTGTRVGELDPDGDGVSQPWTTVTLRVEQALKGEFRAGDTLSFRQMGGTVGQTTLRTPGLPQFAAGDRVLLFLNARLDNPAVSPLVGWSQGCWRIRTGGDGAAHAARDFSGACFATLRDGRLVAAKKPDSREEPLDDLLERFQAVLSGDNR